MTGKNKGKRNRKMRELKKYWKQTKAKSNASLAIWLFVIAMVGGLLVGYNYMRFRTEMLREARNIPPIKEISPFKLTNQYGETLMVEDLQGKVTLMNIIFTRCPGPCPKLSQDMAEWQEKVKDLEDVQLISVTVDPEYDTPEVLAKYAESYGAIQGKWHFTTGNKDEILRMVRKDLLLVVQNNPEEAVEEHGLFIHSTRIVLVDKRGMIRAYYDAESPEAMEKLEGDIQHLLNYKNEGPDGEEGKEGEGA